MPHEMDRCPRVARGREEPRQVGARFEMNVGHACNNHCRFCMQADSPPEHRRFVPLERFKEELAYYRGQGVTELGVLGGEPTLYPHLLEALNYAKEHGYTAITINSNGSRFADAAFTRSLVEAGVTRFALSIHSPRPEVEDHLSNHPGVFALKLKGLHNILALKREVKPELGISLNPVLNRLNMDHITEFIDFFRDMGIPDIRFNAIRPEGAAAGKADLVPPYRSLVPLVVRALVENEKRQHVRLSFGEIPFCVWPRSFWRNRRLRDRYLGEHSDQPTSITEFVAADETGRRRFLWQDIKCGVLKTATDACAHCPARPACGGVWTGYLALYGDGEFTPLTEEDMP